MDKLKRFADPGKTMDKLKPWSNRLWCRIVGCQYAHINLQSHLDKRTQMCTFRNRCLRCGREYKCTIPFIDRLEHEPIRLED